MEKCEQMKSNEKFQTLHKKFLHNNFGNLKLMGCIHRTVYQEVPPKVEYTISEHGKSLMQIMNELFEWGKDHQMKRLND